VNALAEALVTERRRPVDLEAHDAQRSVIGLRREMLDGGSNPPRRSSNVGGETTATGACDGPGHALTCRRFPRPRDRGADLGAHGPNQRAPSRRSTTKGVAWRWSTDAFPVRRCTGLPSARNLMGLC
jgi:hypothetical protein